MTKLVLKNISKMLALIAGVDLILFLVLQSSVFGDPLARETSYSNDQTLLISAAQRLGHISSSNHSAWEFTLSGSKEQNYDVSMRPNFQVRDGERLVFSAPVVDTLQQLVDAINRGNNKNNIAATATVAVEYANLPYANIAMVYLGNKLKVPAQHSQQAAVLSPISQPRRFVTGLANLLRLDFGTDFQSRPIGSTLLHRGSRSLSIALPAFICIFLGAFLMAAAVQHRRRAIKVMNVVAVTCMAFPALLWIFMIRQIVVIDMQWAPLRPFSEPVLPLLILPILITVFIGLWPEYLLMRSFVDDRMSQPFMRAARAQGISRSRIWWHHLLPNLAGPLAQHVALNVPFLLLGTILLETIFNIPGLGISVVEAIQNHDSNMLRAITFVIAITFLLLQAAATIIARQFDPRQRSEARNQ